MYTQTPNYSDSMLPKLLPLCWRRNWTLNVFYDVQRVLTLRRIIYSYAMPCHNPELSADNNDVDILVPSMVMKVGSDR